MKTRIERHDCFPILYPDDIFGRSVDVDEETARRWSRVMKEFDLAQSEMESELQKIYEQPEI